MLHVGNLGEKEVKRFRMKVLANTNQGRRREQNEDYYYISDGFSTYDIYMLADGMGRLQGRRNCK